MPEIEIQFNELQVGMTVRVMVHQWELSIEARGFDWVIARTPSNHTIFLEPKDEHTYIIYNE